MTQVVECLPNKCKDLSSNSSPTKKKKEERKKNLPIKLRHAMDYKMQTDLRSGKI
jgi:hypothetical protein